MSAANESWLSGKGCRVRLVGYRESQIQEQAPAFVQTKREERKRMMSTIHMYPYGSPTRWIMAGRTGWW